jgi:hypothetical protein
MADHDRNTFAQPTRSDVMSPDKQRHRIFYAAVITAAGVVAAGSHSDRGLDCNPRYEICRAPDVVLHDEPAPEHTPSGPTFKPPEASATLSSNSLSTGATYRSKT